MKHVFRKSIRVNDPAYLSALIIRFEYPAVPDLKGLRGGGTLVTVEEHPDITHHLLPLVTSRGVTLTAHRRVQADPGIGTPPSQDVHGTGPRPGRHRDTCFLGLREGSKIGVENIVFNVRNLVKSNHRSEKREIPRGMWNMMPCSYPSSGQVKVPD